MLHEYAGDLVSVLMAAVAGLLFAVIASLVRIVLLPAANHRPDGDQAGQEGVELRLASGETVAGGGDHRETPKRKKKRGGELPVRRPLVLFYSLGPIIPMGRAPAS